MIKSLLLIISAGICILWSAIIQADSSPQDDLSREINSFMNIKMNQTNLDDIRRKYNDIKQYDTKRGLDIYRAGYDGDSCLILYYRLLNNNCSQNLEIISKTGGIQKENKLVNEIKIYDANYFRLKTRKYFNINESCENARTYSGLNIGSTKVWVRQTFGMPTKESKDYWEYSEIKGAHNLFISLQFDNDKVIKMILRDFIDLKADRGDK